MAQERRDQNNFLMDLENWVLEHRWDARIGIPCGPQRHLDHLWGQVMEEEIADYYPRRTYKEYCDWVVSGGGDEWFQPGGDAPDQVYIEAQARQRMAYLCRETVMPLKMTLYDRAVPLALASLRSTAPVNGCAAASDDL